MKKLNGIFDRYDVAVSLFVDVIDDGRERCRLARTRCTGNQYQTPVLVRDRVQNRRKTELSKTPDVIRYYAGNNADRIALLENVYAETAEAGNAVSDIDLVYLFKMLLLPVRHHRERHFERLVLIQLCSTGHRLEFTVDTDHRH